MNAAPNASSTGGGLTKTVLGAVFFILVVVGLYYLYQFLYGKASGQADITLLDGSKSMTAESRDAALGVSYVAGTKMAGLLDGGQYTVNFWAYIADTKGLATTPSKLAHLFEISKNRFSGTKGKTMLFVGLNPLNGTLVVRQSADSDTTLDNALTGTSITPTNYPLSNLINNFSTTGVANDDRCDLINGIEYQRWVMITCIANGRTLDVYLDGKLARSCVYRGNFSLGSSDGTADALFGVNNGGALKGFLSGGRFYNYALAPDAVWSLYQGGPSGYFNVGSFFKNLFNIDVGFEKSANLNP